MNGITDEMLTSLEQNTKHSREDGILSAALAKTDMAELAFVPASAAPLRGAFEVEVKTRGITAQKKSGRCWMFAVCNICREIVAKKQNLEQFELSQNYLTFYDKLEKANNLLDMAIEYAREPLHGQRWLQILKGMDDGGFWTQAVDLVKKYGMVPKTAYPETYQSEHTELFLREINRLLAKDEEILRNLVLEGKKEEAEAKKQEMLSEIYRAECIAFGVPPKIFDFSVRDRDGKFAQERDLTPKSFYEKYIGLDLDDYVPILQEPNKALHTPIIWHGMENMTGSDMFALNLPEEEMEDLCVAQLRAGHAIWFACDSRAFEDRKEGVWDPDSVNFAGLLGGFDAAMTKAGRLDYRQSLAVHAMILVGVSFDRDGKPSRWKIENSWGEEAGEKGYFVCSEKYFREYVYEAVIRREFLTKEQREDLKKKPIRIEAWEEE